MDSGLEHSSLDGTNGKNFLIQKRPTGKKEHQYYCHCYQRIAIRQE